jgi:hypothetical protein
LAVALKGSTPKLMAAFLFCAVLYALIYARLVHFRWTRPRLRLSRKNKRLSADKK